MRYLGQVLGFTIIFMVFIAGCISNSVKDSNIQIPTVTQIRTYIVAATVTQQGNNIVITYQGGQDAIMVSELRYGIGTTDHKWNSPKIGSSVTLPGTSGKDHVIVVATFADGVEHVIVDTYV